jgi:dynein heavy chain
MLPKKNIGPEYKEEYKRKHHSKFLSNDPEVKEKFGVFKVTELLKPEDREHFRSLYEPRNELLDQFTLPDEKKEKSLKEQKKKETEKLEREKKEAQMSKEVKDVTEESLQFMEQLQNEEQNVEDQNIKTLKDTFLKIFDKKLQRLENKELEVELYLKKNSKIAKAFNKLGNGEEAVQFFAMYGNTTPIKFIFCRKRVYDKVYIYEPYELEIIKDKRIETIRSFKDYFIITPTGITHIYLSTSEEGKREKKQDRKDFLNSPEVEKNQKEEANGEDKRLNKFQKQVAEFYTLSDWMYQSTLFKVLRKINYFKNYLPFKIFTIWRNYNRFSKFLRIRNQLGSKLFLTKPAFVNSLIQCNGQINQIEKVRLHDVTYQTWVEKGLLDFDEHQKNTVDTIARNSFKSLIETDIFKTIRNLYKLVNSHLRENKEIDDTENAKTLQELKNKSMYILKLEKQMRKKLIKMALFDTDLFERFVNLVDLMSVEMFFLLNKRSLKDIKGELSKERKDSNFTGIFTIFLTSFNEGIIQLSPNEKEMEEKFKILFKLITECLVEAPRFNLMLNKKDYDTILLTDEKLSYGDIDRGLTKTNEFNDERVKQNFKELLEKNKYYKKFTDSIYSKLSRDYEHAYEKTKETFEMFKRLQTDKETWKAEEFIKEKVKLEEVENKLQELERWAININDLLETYIWNIMAIDVHQTKKDFADYIDRSNQVLKGYVKEKYLKNKERIAEIKEEGDKILAKKRKDIATGYQFKDALDKYQPRLNKLKRVVDKFNFLKEMIYRYKFDGTLANSDLTDYEILKGTYVEMESKVKGAYVDIEKTKEQWRTEAEDEIQIINENLNKINEYITTGILLEVETPPDRVREFLASIDENLKKFSAENQKYNEYYEKLEFKDKPGYKLVNMVERNFDLRKRLWDNLLNLDKDIHDWRYKNLSELKDLKIDEKMKEYSRVCGELNFELNEGGLDKVCEYFKEKIRVEELNTPSIVALACPSLQERNWKEIFGFFKIPFHDIKTLEEITLGELLNNNLTAYIEKLEFIATASFQQEKISKDLEKITGDWDNTDLKIMPYNKSKDKFIISSIEEIKNQLDEHGQLIQSALASKFVDVIRDKVQKWDDELTLINRIIDEWIMCQKQWIYLENIFSADDIKRQIPDAHKNFSRVNKGFRELMNKANHNRNCIENCRQEGLYDRLCRYHKELDHIQKSLEDYLQTKRKAFPRFYFLSNDELLKILSQTRNPRAVQDYLGKCFDGIKTITFASLTSNEILTMIAPENEEIKLNRTLIANENIEGWLNELEEIMFSTIYDECKLCLEAYPEFQGPRKDWIYKGFPCQAVLTIDQVMWAYFVEMSLEKVTNGEKQALEDFSAYMENLIIELAEMVTEKAGELKKALVERLIIINVHARDVVKDLIAEGVTEKNNFEWQKNLKFYWEDELTRKEVVMKQTNSRFIYGYEYLGNPERMVITPLTDKCYITLTSALHLNYGGAPAGPAGTGKTETTKDLSKALAIKVNVFNCSDQLDYKLMGRMFCGLAECGAWACFDEFNRIDVEVLSVIAKQIETIQSALRAKEFVLNFEDRMIKLKPRFGVFITMNPTYAGRSALPDNLKSLFRPVAMMIPDYALVSQVTLFSKGFKQAKELSIKMFQLFKLSSEQLSKQKHYDFGLRGIKSILSRAGYLREKFSTDPENVVLIRAMKDSNLPKFLDNDIELFLDIISDLFPKTEVIEQPNQIFLNKVKEILEKDHLQLKPRFIEKINQLLDTMMVRLGNMLVGETGTGKTTCYQTLVKALTELGKDKSLNDEWFCHINLNLLNPKSVTKSELYMSKDEVTQTWDDGIVAKIMREAEEEEKEEVKGQNKRRWVIFDGPVDALWIEDMNTVLDDSRKLCLPDSSNIRIPKMMNLIFEVRDLKEASPATVSRNGMVYLEPQHVGHMTIIDTWSQTYKAKLRQFFEDDGSIKQKTSVDQYMRCFDKLCDNMRVYISNLIDVIRSSCIEKIPSVNINLVQSCINLLTCFINPEVVKLQSDKVEELFNCHFIFCLVWSLGANIEDDSRIYFQKGMRDVISKLGVNLDIGMDIYGVYVNEFAKFNGWHDKKDHFRYDSKISFFNILVPTTDTVRYKFLMTNLCHHNYNSLFMGDTGVGKSVIILDFLEHMGEGYQYKSSNFSAKTTSKNVFDALKSSIYRNGNFQPGPGKKFVYFIDDINLPQYDKFGSQQPIEFVRQLIDMKAFYDEKKTPKKIKDVMFMAACAPPSGGRMVVTPRLFRHFNMVWMNVLSPDSMKQIFKSILEGFIDQTDKSNKDLLNDVEELMTTAIELYRKIQKEKLPTPSKSHYTFNLRDLSKVVQGMLQSRPENIEDKTAFVNLWVHETSRQFRDRLIGEDIVWFDKEMYKIYEYKFNLGHPTFTIDQLIFTTIIDKIEYKRVTDFPLLTKRINDRLEAYNNANRASPMHLVFFTDAINHFCRIARIICQERGNALLVGLGGSGRQSLAKLVGNYLGYPLNSLQIGKGYGVEQFWKNIGEILLKVGNSGENSSQIFMFSDTQILEESFLEDINNILNNGEVPNLFKDDQLSLIFNTLKEHAKNSKKNYVETKDGIYQYFVDNVRDRLRIVLCFSPVGEGFRNRCRQFPSIINCCTIDWFNVWPNEALKSVAERNFLNVPTYSTFEPELVTQLSNLFVKIHSKALKLSERFEAELRRYYYITPTSYLEYIKLFNDIYNEKISILPKQISNYRLGIQKLDEANIIVRNLKEELIRKEPEQIQSKDDVEKIMIEVEENSKIVEAEKNKLKGENEAVAAERDKILIVQRECDSDLSKAKPQLDEAQEALSKLNEDDMRVMRAFNTVSDNLKNLAALVSYIFNSKVGDYSDLKVLMKDGKGFIEKCKSTKDVVAALNDPRKLKETTRLYTVIESIDFSKVSEVAKGLKTWAGALLQFIQIYRVVKPKMEDLEVANKKLAIVEADLAEKSQNLRSVEKKLSDLKKTFDEKNKELKKLNTDIENIKIKSKRAVRLVDGLKDEGKRWKESIKILEEEEKSLLANVVISASIVSYSGPFTIEYRKEFLKAVIEYIRDEGITYQPTEEFNLQKILCDPLTIRQWTASGLPADDLSIENAIITTRSKRYPLIIDPQMQANKWIKSFFKNQDIKSYKITNKNLFNRLKDCISSGYPCLIENVEQVLDSALEPILQNITYKMGAAIMLALGNDKPIQFSPGFKLFMTSKLASPHYLPETAIKVTLINFTVTAKGLEDQLLVEVVKHERSDLEEQKDTLIMSINQNKEAIKNLEMAILNLVKDANDEILENDILVNKLDQSKEQSERIAKDLEIAEATAVTINKERRVYRPIAKRGSIIYFAIASLANVDPMYNYSLEYFAKLFNQRLAKSEQSSDVLKRVEILIEDLTISYFEKISRGLFEKDKLLYAYLILTNIMLQNEKITKGEWNFFLRGGMSGSRIEESPVPWLSVENFRKIMSLKDLNINYFKIDDIFKKSIATPEDEAKWKEFLSSDSPYNVRLPDNFEAIADGNDFHKVVFVKLLREEKLIFAIKAFIEKNLGKRFLEPPAFNIGSAFDDSLNSTPLIFILSPGANPIAFLKRLAEDKGIKLENISLGQGQGEKAKNKIFNAKELGQWICLENCHLSLSFMPKLEEIIEELDESDMHPDYRLWLTTMPTDKFPVSVLQNGVKLTNEPPKGIKANLKGTYQNLTEKDLESTKPFQYNKLVFSLAFFHAIILERRKFGPLGWNMPYEWMNSDFEASKMHIKMYLEEHKDVPFKILQFLIGIINYGGRVTDDKDSKLISAVLKKYFNTNIFKDNYKFSDSGMYYAPKQQNLTDIFDYLESLPLDDAPDVFGLHSNANITLQNKMVKEFMDPLIAIQPKDTGSSSHKPDDIVLDVIKQIETKLAGVKMLNKSMANEESILDKERKGKKSPLGNFLLQECDKFNNLYKIIDNNLKYLEKAVKGESVMSPDIEKIYYSFLNNQVPTLFEENAYLSLKPLLSWVTDLIERIRFMSDWLLNGVPKSFWISAFFFPQGKYLIILGFNTALLQTYARKTHEPIDSLTFRSNIINKKKEEIDVIPENGFNIYGLYLQGASWSWTDCKLKEPHFGELWHEMPVIW